ncbi:MAG: response regulator [Cyanobacteria bacterium Co-bin13]|nr:response regulator [Cyanobacteria bacterium Co-bin13]
MPPLRILLVDDSLPFLELATRLLSAEAFIHVVGRALSGSEALAQVLQLRPDLVLMDLAMPGMNGLEATRQIKLQTDAPYVIVLTLNDNSEYRIAAEAVGADGFVPKLDFSDALLPLISSLIR